MKKCILVEYPGVTVNFYVDAEFFGAGGEFKMQNLEEKIMAITRENDTLILSGEKFTKCRIAAPDDIVDKIHSILNGYIGALLKDIENIEIE
ncbi:MAG: hypothetical protein WA066_07640 [Candidatus Omnitrophota bacterium]